MLYIDGLYKVEMWKSFTFYFRASLCLLKGLLGKTVFPDWAFYLFSSPLEFYHFWVGSDPTEQQKLKLILKWRMSLTIRQILRLLSILKLLAYIWFSVCDPRSLEDLTELQVYRIHTDIHTIYVNKNILHIRHIVHIIKM